MITSCRFLIIIGALQTFLLLPNLSPSAQNNNVGDEVQVVLKPESSAYTRYGGKPVSGTLIEKNDKAHTIKMNVMGMGMDVEFNQADILSMGKGGATPIPAASPAGTPETAPQPKQLSPELFAKVRDIRVMNENLQYYKAIQAAIELLNANPQAGPLVAPELNTSYKSLLGEIENKARSIPRSNSLIEGPNFQNNEINQKILQTLDALQNAGLQEQPGSFASDNFRRSEFVNQAIEIWISIDNKDAEYVAASVNKAMKGTVIDRALKSIKRFKEGYTDNENLPVKARLLFNEAALLAFAGDNLQAIQILEQAQKAAEGRTDELPAQISKFKKSLVDATQPESVATPEGNENVAKAKELWKQYGTPIADYATENVVLVIILIVAIIAFWGLPIHLINRDISRSSLLASLWKKSVVCFGFAAYGIYLIQNHRQNKAPADQSTDANKRPVPAEARKKGKGGSGSCPSCGKIVNQVQLYRELDFEKCPHCYAAIMPLFTSEDYIRGVVSKLDLGANRGKKGKNDTDSQMSALIDAMYIMAVRRRATDIHIERDDMGATVQFRVDGMIVDGFKLPVAAGMAFLSSIKVQANLDITNHMTPQDGRYQYPVLGNSIDIRMNTSPASQGEILFMRLLDKRNIQIRADVLGFEGQKLVDFEAGVRKPHGLILVTGPTGSGKSTTLYVALNQINNGERNILTIEDPVEYMMQGLKQMQVSPEKGFTFATGLRSILRQDPDVIMVGEIRDTETAQMAIDAAVTGHLVLTTLHTMDTTSAISRLADLNIAATRYASALEMIIAQRLIRMICAECKEPRQPGDANLERLGIQAIAHSIKFMAGAGCLRCNSAGYYGRQAILEILHPDEEMRSYMEHETSPQKLREMARRKGMRTLREEGVMKIMRGITTVEEVVRVTI